MAALTINRPCDGMRGCTARNLVGTKPHYGDLGGRSAVPYVSAGSNFKPAGRSDRVTPAHHPLAGCRRADGLGMHQRVEWCACGSSVHALGGHGAESPPIVRRAVVGEAPGGYRRAPGHRGVVHRRLPLLALLVAWRGRLSPWGRQPDLLPSAGRCDAVLHTLGLPALPAVRRRPHPRATAPKAGRLPAEQGIADPSRLLDGAAVERHCPPDDLDPALGLRLADR